MPASAVLQSSGSADALATRMVPFFAGVSSDGQRTLHTGPRWQAHRVHVHHGPAPENGMAEVLIPLKDLDDKSPAVAGVRNGPIEAIKVNMRACVLLGN